MKIKLDTKKKISKTVRTNGSSNKSIRSVNLLDLVKPKPKCKHSWDHILGDLFK